MVKLQNLILLQNLSRTALILRKYEILQKAGVLLFKPYAEFMPIYLGFSTICTAEAKNHPDRT